MSTSESTAAQLMAALSSTLGEQLELDASGQCGLAFKPDIELVIAHALHDDEISVRVALGDGAALSEQALRGALALNYGRLRPGYAIAYDEVSRQLVLFVLLRVSTTEAEGFIELLTDLVQLIPDLRSELVRITGADTNQLSSPPNGVLVV